jgi:hypothetical protein
MDESEFWACLEYRICAAFAGFEDNALRLYWCDGLVPEQYGVVGGQSLVSGFAWIGQGHKQERWDFTLTAWRPLGARNEIDWPALLPAKSLTGWLRPDPQRKSLKIDLASANDT